MIRVGFIRRWTSLFQTRSLGTGWIRQSRNLNTIPRDRRRSEHRQFTRSSSVNNLLITFVCRQPALQVYFSPAPNPIRRHTQNQKHSMKTREMNGHTNENGNVDALVARAQTAQKLADAARKHFKMLKSEQKQARKAFRQARKAAKRARKEAEVAVEALAAKQTRASGRSRSKPAVRRQASVQKAKPQPMAALTPQPTAHSALASEAVVAPATATVTS